MTPPKNFSSLTPLPPPPVQDKSSGGSVDTTKTRSGPQRVRMSSGERPTGAAKSKQSDTGALCQNPPPVPFFGMGGGGGVGRGYTPHPTILHTRLPHHTMPHHATRHIRPRHTPRHHAFEVIFSGEYTTYQQGPKIEGQF